MSSWIEAFDGFLFLLKLKLFQVWSKEVKFAPESFGYDSSSLW